MIPANQLGNIDRRGSWLHAVRKRGWDLKDVEYGGVAINDASQGSAVKLWTAEYRNGDVLLWADDVPETVLFNRSGITQIALAFDQLMAPFIAFEDSGGVAYWWFNPKTAQHEFSGYLPAGSTRPRATLDDTRYLANSWSDIILAYMRGGHLYYRQQRDNYVVERLLKEEVGGTLRAVGMNAKLSLQFSFDPAAP